MTRSSAMPASRRPRRRFLIPDVPWAAAEKILAELTDEQARDLTKLLADRLGMSAEPPGRPPESSEKDDLVTVAGDGVGVVAFAEDGSHAVLACGRTPDEVVSAVEAAMGGADYVFFLQPSACGDWRFLKDVQKAAPGRCAGSWKGGEEAFSLSETRECALRQMEA